MSDEKITKMVLNTADPAQVEAMHEVLQALRRAGVRTDGSGGLVFPLDNGEQVEVTSQVVGGQATVVLRLPAGS